MRGIVRSLQVRRQVLYIDRLAHYHHRRMTQNIFQFPNISRPGVKGEAYLRSLCEAPDRFVELRCEFFN